jgi:plastocyanin
VALLTVAVVAPLALGACSDDSSTETADESSTTSSAAVVNTGPTVEVEGLSFAPSVENVAVGETVTWSNTGDSRHTVTPEPLADGTDPWESTPLDPGQTFVQTFNTAGTYQYFCSIHPDRMTGSVVVAGA